MSHDLQPQKRTTETAGGIDEETVERDADWHDACAAVDDAFCEWLHAPAEELAGSFAMYRAALDREASVATTSGVVVDGSGVVVDRLRLGDPGVSRSVDGERSLSEAPPAARGQGVRVLIADRDAFARRVLLRALHEVGEIAMATAARDGREALQFVRRDLPDLLLVDIGVPPSGGVELIRRIVGDQPRVRIVTLSAGTDWDQAISAALRAGAVGHIDKDTDPDQIARLVVRAAAGEAIVPRRLMTRPVSELARGPADG